ncbi:MAG: hypothetical protein ICV83_29920 [Cytophagales bacterium]|nr:hypothetical protein [Cytophagales bacterium]MBD0343091.1 hypothetical protein [Microcoleus sp. Co-bin12]
MSDKAFDSTPKRVVKKDGKFMLEIIENYTPSDRKIPREITEKMDKELAERIEEVRNKLLKSK